MKKFIPILIASIGINFYLSAQSTGDYRSAGSGNWNDATKWETFNGSSWIAAAFYPGQNPGTGAVTVMNETKITISSSLPQPIASLYVSGEFFCNGCPGWEGSTPLFGILTFSSETAVSLMSLGEVKVYGELRLEDLNGANTHSISIGGRLIVGGDGYWDYYDYDYYYVETPTVFQTVNQDEKLKVLFNTTMPNSYIRIGIGVTGIVFDDVTFNGIGLLASGRFLIKHANFINGIISTDEEVIMFIDGATVSGASNASFVNGRVSKMGDDPFVFPVGYKSGGQGVYSPLTISAPIGVTETFSAGYYIAAVGSVPTISDPGLYNISNCEFWMLGKSSGNSVNYSLDVTIGWNAASACGSSQYIENVSNVTIAKSTSEVWTSHGGSGTGTNTNGSVTWYGVSNLEDYPFFRLGNLNTSCTVPSGLSATNTTSNSAILNWSAVSGALSYDVDYKLATSCCWINAATASTSTSISLLGLNPLLTYDWRVRAHCGSSSSAYRMSQLTTAPATCNSPSGLTTTNISSNSAMLSWNAVTNAVNYNVQYKPSGSTTWVTGVAAIVSLSCTLSGLAASTAYDWRVSANCGIYTQSSFSTLCNDVYEPNNAASQAKTIGTGIPISAGISSATDVDWFKIEIPGNSNASLTILLGDIYGNLPSEYDLYVYNKNLVLIGSSATTATEAVTVNARGKNLRFYIKVVSENGTYVPQCYPLVAEISESSRPTVSASAPINEVHEEKSKALLYPNPASEFVYLNFNSPKEGLINIQIVNSIGQLVKQIPVNAINGHNQFKIQVADIRPGMYILRIKKGDLILTRKFVIAR